MHAAELNALETTVHKTREWLNDIMMAIGTEDAHFAYGALRAVLHALRDRLTLDEAVQFGAQLPMLVRGLYYEGWQPRGKPDKTHKPEFLDVIRHQFPGPERLHPEVIARAVLGVISRHVSAGEVQDVKSILPKELRTLWPVKEGEPAIRHAGRQ